jgi:hypothetical protein
MKMACCACDGARTVPVRSAWFTKEASEVHDVSWLADVLRTETVRAPLQPGREPSRAPEHSALNISLGTAKMVPEIKRNRNDTRFEL